MKACTAEVENGEEKRVEAGKNTEEGKGDDNGYVKREEQKYEVRQRWWH